MGTRSPPTLSEHTSGSQGPPWEAISRIPVGTVLKLSAVCIPTHECEKQQRGNEVSAHTEQTHLWFPRSSVGIHTKSSGQYDAEVKRCLHSHAGAWERGNSTQTLVLNEHTSGSHGPPWESISKVPVSTVLKLGAVCIPTRERGNEITTHAARTHLWFPRSPVGIHIKSSDEYGAEIKRCLHSHAGAWERGNSTQTLVLNEHTSGSHGPPWESISRVPVSTVLKLWTVCIPTRERGNEVTLREPSF